MINLTISGVSWNPTNKNFQINRGYILWSPNPLSMEGKEADQTQQKGEHGNLLVYQEGSYGKDIMGEAVTCLLW